jgi:AraC family transcriptional activator of mar-sox-rob regulon
MGMDRSSLSRLFRRYHGEPLAAYIRAERLNRAVRRLRESGDTLEEIAQTCGYADAFSFGKAFRTYFGQSPGRYRAALMRRGGTWHRSPGTA